MKTEITVTSDDVCTLLNTLALLIQEENEHVMNPLILPHIERMYDALMEADRIVIE